ncbi:FHA domain-containing protein [Nannocystis sp. ILAH1]|uniref:FHA domain-containing protein n=1 Tax=unclassified Nannocystis TaxID=2627009 RepID=UPI00226F324F|nr:MULTISPECIES: FHA domain-containing protein [unclassified Nannocystis]MCY0986615.1 FHA domain-containing protein [Nannocystis sp. ILAH1]MCY1071496.1 FHA domain-containing protein [Nannocystis sp. RBIL2]
MAELRRTNGAGAWFLRERSILGRSRVCNVQLEDSRVSGEHALVRWNGRAWEIQDLGSRNGTFVAGRRLGLGERVSLSPGTTLGFGSPDGYVFAGGEPPTPFAVPLDEGPAIEAQDGLLVLPQSDEPELTVYRGGNSGWSIEQAGEVRATEDGAVVRSASGAWRLHLPGALPLTDESSRSGPTIDTIGLRFRVSGDEETVELLALHPGGVIDLKVRVHHYPLLLLARVRLRDASVPADRQGWIEQNDLLRQLRCEGDRLYIDIFRSRRQLAQAGIADAARLIERRPGTGLLRIGVGSLEVVPLLER